MDVQQYLREIAPMNVTDLIDYPVLENLLNGYSFGLGSGITIVYPTELVVTLSNLERRDARGRDAPSTFHPLCAFFRKPSECDREQDCIDADKRVALNYFNGSWAGPKLYRCFPLSLWDMTFPLYSGHRVIGVLFGGQIIIRDGPANWREALREYKEMVDWSTCPASDDHIAAVEKAITKSPVTDSQKDWLRDILHGQSSPSGENITLKEFIKRIDAFLRFGQTTQGLIDELHKARKTASEQRLLRDYSEAFARIDIADRAKWQAECSEILKRLILFPEIDSISLYVRNRAYYLYKMPSPSEQAIEPLVAREVAPAFPAGKLVPIVQRPHSNLVDELGLGRGNLWGYRSETGDGREVCSTFISLKGPIDETRKDLIESMCSVICTAVDSAHLIFRIREAEAQYQLKVSLIGHSFRTPLQIIQFVLEGLNRSPVIGQSPELKSKVAEGIARIQDAGEDLQQLLNASKQLEEDFDLINVVNYIFESMDSLARNHPCGLVKVGIWPATAFVRANRYRVQRALTCLVDNAIKYSYGGKRFDRAGLYEVRVRVIEVVGYVKVVTENYGIGIPPGKLDAIKEYGMRANVPDEKRKRMGNGLGLPFAISVLEQYGGWLDITSVPSESATQAEINEYHRYKTTVEAVLPLVKRRK